MQWMSHLTASTASVQFDCNAITALAVPRKALADQEFNPYLLRLKLLR